MKIVTLFFTVVSLELFAQQPVQNFSLINVADNNSVSLESFASSGGVVILFTGNECIFDNYYNTRVKSLIDAYKGKIQFLLVNSYVEPTEAIDKMKTKYSSWSIGVPYLADKQQTLMDALGARKSPEAFLLKNTNGKFSVVYSGAIDDNAQLAADVKQNYLRDGIEKLLVGKKIEVSNVRATGCSVRKK
jgi:hypothetical protein